MKYFAKFQFFLKGTNLFFETLKKSFTLIQKQPDGEKINRL